MAVLIVNEGIVKKRSDCCLSVEGWSTGFDVAEGEPSGMILLHTV